MFVKILKTGPYAHPDPTKGITRLKEGEITNVDNELATSLMFDKWAEPVDLEKLTKQDLVTMGAPEDLTKPKMIEHLGLT